MEAEIAAKDSSKGPVGRELRFELSFFLTVFIFTFCLAEETTEDFGQNNFRRFNRGNKLKRTAREGFQVDPSRQTIGDNAQIDEEYTVRTRLYSIPSSPSLTYTARNE